MTVAAINIAFVTPKTKPQILLYSIFVPIFLYLWVVFFKGYSDSFSHIYNTMVVAFGESFVPIIVTIPLMFFCLKKKLKVGKQYKLPKGIIVTIIILFILGFISEWGGYNRKKTLEKIKENTSTIQNQEKARKQLQDDVALTNQNLPLSRGGMMLKNMVFEDNTLTFSYIIDEALLDYNEVIDGVESDKLDFFKTSTGYNQEFINKVVLAGCDYKMKFEAEPSGKTNEFTLTAKDLKKAYFE